MWLRLVLIGLPLVEIVLFIRIGGLIGVWPVVALVILAAVAGVLLLRRGGLRLAGEVQAAMRAGHDPGQQLANGAMVMLAAVLLIVPGFFSDTLALLLLLPRVRGAIYRRLSARLGGTVHAASDVIEGEYVELRDHGGPRPPSPWTEH